MGANLGANLSFAQAPPNSHIVTIEGKGDCKGESCKSRPWDPLMPQPTQASAWTAQKWTDFVNQMGALVRRYKPDGFAFLLFLLVLIPLVAITVLPVDSKGRFLRFLGWVLASASILLLFVGGGLKIANQKVDAQIEELCRSFSDGSVTLKYNTQFTGMCKPKHSRVVRELWITAGDAAAVAAVASVAPVPQTQMMQVACPAGMKAGETVQIVTPAGPMQVVIPQGVSEGQTFSVQVAAPQPQPVAVVTAVPMAVPA